MSVKIITTKELYSDISKFKKTMPYLQTYLDKISEYEKKFSTDESIIAASYFILEEQSPLADFISYLIYLFGNCYENYLCPIDQIRLMNRIFNNIPDKELTSLIFKNFEEGEIAFVYFDKDLRTILNNNIPEDRRHKYEIIYNNSIKENVEKVLKILEAY
jgi:hypothetical protein